MPLRQQALPLDYYCSATFLIIYRLLFEHRKIIYPAHDCWYFIQLMILDEQRIQVELIGASIQKHKICCPDPPWFVSRGHISPGADPCTPRSGPPAFQEAVPRSTPVAPRFRLRRPAGLAPRNRPADPQAARHERPAIELGSCCWE